MKILPPNSLSLLLLLAPFSGLIGIPIGYGGILYLGQLYPDAVNRINDANPNNYYLAYFLFNLATLVSLVIKPIRDKIFIHLLQLNFIVWILYGVYIIVCTNLMDIVVLRRIAFGSSMVAMLPLTIYFFGYVRKKTIKNYFIAFSLPLLLFIAMVPGFFFPPFYDGIAGWTSNSINQQTPIQHKGYQLVRDDGETIWYTSNFFSPITQIGRFSRALDYTMRDEPERKFLFLYENYKRVYTILEEGKLPHQKILGRFAYPTHNLSKFNPEFLQFHPDQISSIQEKKVIINRKTGELIRNEIIHEYDVKYQKILK